MTYTTRRAADTDKLRSLAYVAPQGGAAGGVVGGAAAVQERNSGPAPLALMDAARKLIRNGQLSLEIRDYAQAAEQVARIAESHGGYVADSQTTRADSGKRRGQVMLRVPAAQFGRAVDALKALGRVDSENVTSQDVTKAFADLETRLRVKRETEARLREILRTRTARLSDILEAEGQLARLIEEIEQMEGERRFYDQQVALSTITLQLYEPLAVVRPGLIEPIRRALRRSLELLAASAAALILLLVVVTPWAIVALCVWQVVRVVRRRTIRRSASTT
jgi:hypothetical protein